MKNTALAGMCRLKSTQERMRIAVMPMIAAKDMTGIDDHRVLAIPHETLRTILRKYNRLTN